jgi:prolyl 4-hydroxylase
VYGIRIYHTGAILAPHVDRLPLVSSCIINVAQDVDEDWLLEVYDHSGQAHNVSMAPGDLVLYESHSIIHGRPFPLKGKYYANIFVHFEPLGPPKGSTIPYKFDEENPLPPYLLADHPWVDDWRSQFPNGWSALESAVELTQRGDLKALRYLAEVNPNRLAETDGTPAEWQSIHEAARNGQLDIIKFLVEENEIDVNTPSKVTGAVTPLAIAMNHLKSDHPVIEYLIEMGGLEEVEEDYDDGEEL